MAIYLDLFTRKIVGYAMKDTLHASLVTEALSAAIDNQRVGAGLVVHTDRGSQYASDDYAMVESFFRTLKVELIYGRKFATRAEAMAAIFEYYDVID